MGISEEPANFEPAQKTDWMELPVEEIDQLSSGETSGLDSPAKDTREETSEIIRYEEGEEGDEETKNEKESFDQRYDQVIKEDYDERGRTEVEEEHYEYEPHLEPEEERDRRIKPEDDDKVPGTPSLPRFKYDKSESAESPHASHEEISKDGLGSKWKLLKTLKERKAEEKNKESESPPPTVSTSLLAKKYNYLYSYLPWKCYLF